MDVRDMEAVLYPVHVMFYSSEGRVNTVQALSSPLKTKEKSRGHKAPEPCPLHFD
jgi:hypothetical protein